ncbi:MAG: HIT domain-containing protein, partial [Candidatus Methylomirabilales bacterium]
MSGTCIFCKIVARESPADIEYEDSEILAFRDLYPKAPTHILIIPKRHIESVATLTEADAELV